MDHDVAIEPFMASDNEHTICRCSVWWNKSRKEVQLNFQLGWVKDRFWSFIIFGSPKANFVLDTWKMNNTKKVNALGAEIEAQIKAKSGRGWDLLNEFANKTGFKIAGDANAAPTEVAGAVAAPAA